MKYFVIFLFLVGLVGTSFALTDNLFYGTSSFERLPSSIIPDDSQIIEIKFQYQDGPYSLIDLKPIIDVSPKEAESFVHIEFDPIEGIYRNSIARIYGTIIVDPEIPSEKIFLNVSYVGTDIDDVLFKSGWNDSVIIDIAQSDTIKPRNRGGPQNIDVIQSEEKYRFIDFSYANIVGEPIKFILERIGYYDCYPYNVEIIDEDGNLVWGEGVEPLCLPNKNPDLIASQIKIGYDEDNPLIINESRKYYIQIEIDNIFTKREFVVRQNHTGVSLDRTVYPIPWIIESPLKQFKSGVPFDETQCKDNLVLIQKYDGSSACVESKTIPKLIQRGWIDTDPREQADKNIPKFLCELYGGGFFDGTGECMDLESSSKCQMLGGQWDGKCMIPYYAGKGIGTKPDFDPHPEPDCIDGKCMCPDGYSYNQVLFKCVLSCEDDLVYNGYTDLCTTEFELKYHGFCNDGFTYDPLAHICNSDDEGNSVSLSHEPLKDPPRTPPPEPEPERESASESQLRTAKKSLHAAYREHVNLGPYYMKDVVVGFGTYDDVLIVDIASKYTDSDSFQTVKKEIQHIVGNNIDVDYVVYDEPIERHIETVIPYLWNKILHQNKIDFTPKEQNYWNDLDGFLEHDKVCSPLVTPNGTEFFISSTFNLEPFEVTGTFIDKTEPDDCHKIWKTAVLMTEPDRVTALWLENEN